MLTIGRPEKNHCFGKARRCPDTKPIVLLNNQLCLCRERDLLNVSLGDLDDEQVILRMLLHLTTFLHDKNCSGMLLIMHKATGEGRALRSLQQHLPLIGAQRLLDGVVATLPGFPGYHAAEEFVESFRAANIPCDTVSSYVVAKQRLRYLLRRSAWEADLSRADRPLQTIAEKTLV